MQYSQRIAKLEMQQRTMWLNKETKWFNNMNSSMNRSMKFIDNFLKPDKDKSKTSLADMFNFFPQPKPKKTHDPNAPEKPMPS
jgi:hypothetical protein